VTLYTDIEPFCCAVLASRVADGSLPDGDVVMADIHDLGAANLAGYAHIHLFCGIGGMPLGLAWAGWPADRSVLTGGFPCQDISAAGKGAGLDGAKSGLFWELLRILKELNADGEGPESVLLENVGALSRRGLDVVAAALGEAGYVVPESYRVGAWAVGAPHERERWWIVGWRAGRSKPDGVRGGPRNEEAGREGRAGTSASGASEGGREVGDAGGCGGRIDEPRRGSQGRTAPGRPDPTTERGWPVPVLPGYVQHEWELPRLYQRGVGDAVHGLPGRVAAARNRAGIMALGNAVVPQVVKAVATGMREATA
jgi:DNA (cytosine-5)-methyltransferase 1